MKKKAEKVKDGKKDGNRATCTHFLAGRCRHGVNGKKPFNDIEKCWFYHPTICKEYIDNGKMKDGCKDSKKCGKVHPTLCKFSAKSRTCPNMRGGRRCNIGYHLKGTKPEKENDDSQNDDSDSDSSDESDDESEDEVRKKKTSSSQPKKKKSYSEAVKGEKEKSDKKVMKEFFQLMKKLMGKM